MLPGRINLVNKETVKMSALPDSKQTHIGFEYPAIYSIRVIGYLDKSWSNRLSGLNILSYNATSEDGREMTSLTGELIDQGALIGVLNALYNQRLTILSVVCLGIPGE